VLLPIAIRLNALMKEGEEKRETIAEEARE
jgi:hypothetical protein